MDIQTLQESLRELPNATIGPNVSQVKKLAELVDGDAPLQPFLEQLLPLLCELVGGISAVVWMKAQGAPGAVFGVRYKFEEVINTVPEQTQHEKLVQIAWRQKQPMIAEPTMEKLKSKSKDGQNPTGHPLLLSPVLHMGEPLALIEIVLPSSDDSFSQTQRKIYLKVLQLICERVYSGLRQRMAIPLATIQQAAEHVQQLGEEVVALQLQIQKRIEAKLHQFRGWSFGTLSENQAFARMIHKLLDSYGLRAKCPECGNPAILRCLRAGNAKNGAFVFDHYLENGRTFHGGPTTVPLIRVVPKPARRSASTRENS
jgi:hypothetical protein